MRPTEKIKEFFVKSKVKVNPEFDDIILSDVFAVF